MRALVALVTLLVGTTAAWAYCPNVPDNEGSLYIQNQQSHNLCLQHELSRSTQNRNFQTETNSTINQIQRQMLRQRMEQPAFHFSSPFVGRRF